MLLTSSLSLCAANPAQQQQQQRQPPPALRRAIICVQVNFSLSLSSSRLLLIQLAKRHDWPALGWLAGRAGEKIQSFYLRSGLNFGAGQTDKVKVCRPIEIIVIIGSRLLFGFLVLLPQVVHFSSSSGNKNTCCRPAGQPDRRTAATAAAATKVSTRCKGRRHLSCPLSAQRQHTTRPGQSDQVSWPSQSGQQVRRPRRCCCFGLANCY